MAIADISSQTQLRPGLVGRDPAGIAVSWGAIFAGAFAAMATTMILLLIGTGIGLSMISPWSGAGASAATVGIAAVVWLVLMQWLASGVGGYIAGRLRAMRPDLHSHEVFFRDTAHGFVAWAVASLAGALLFASISATGVSGAAGAVGTAANIAAIGAAGTAAGAAQSGGQAGQGRDANGNGYFIDMMFRQGSTGQGATGQGATGQGATGQGATGQGATGSTPPVTNNGGNNGAPGGTSLGSDEAQTGRILARSRDNGHVQLSSDDKGYLTQLVAARAGISPNDAGQRIDTVVGQINAASDKARVAADAARKRAAELSIVMALAMVLGAFIASASAALGGGIRDENQALL